MAPSGPQEILIPSYCVDTAYEIFQGCLFDSIKMASRFPANHPQKAERLEFIEWLILQGADPMKEGMIKGEQTTCMNKALKFGDPQVIQMIKDSMEKWKQLPPVIVTKDLDQVQDEDIVKKLPIAILFPSDGSAYVKMLAEVKDLPACKKLVEKANEILGYDLLDICLNGPESKLDQTKFCQPATFLANACAVEKLKLEKPEVVERAQAAAGLGLGELSAVYFSGVMSFEDTLRMVRVRAEAMNEEVKKVPQATVSVAGLDKDVLEKLCEEVSAKAGTTPEGKDEFVQITNHLFPKGYTCAGTKNAVDLLKDAAEKAGALQARILKNQGGFNTNLMEFPALRLNKGLRANVANMQFPKVDLYMNASGSYQRAGTDPRELNADMTAAMVSPILWQQSIEEMRSQGITEFYECGPMKQLKAMMKRISQDAWEKTYSISV